MAGCESGRRCQASVRVLRLGIVSFYHSPLRHKAVWAVPVVCLAAAAAAQPSIGIALACVLAAAAVWTWPGRVMHSTVFAVLAVRPSLDVFSDRHFGVGPFATSPAVFFGLVVLLIAGVVFARRARQGEQLWPVPGLRTAHLWLLTGYVVALSSGWLFYGGAGFANGVREGTRMLSIVASFWLVSLWAAEDTTRYRSGWTYLVFGSLVPAGVGLWQLMTGTGLQDPDGLMRLQATFSHPNSFGPYLVPWLLLAISAAAASSAGRWQLVYFAAAVATGTLIVLTYSRTAMLAAILGVGLLPLLQARHLGARFLKRVMIAAVCFALVSWFIAGDAIRARFQDISFGRAALEAVAAGESENSFQWRLMNWGQLVALGTEHSIIGHGAGMTMVLNPLVSSVNGVPFNAHNDFVRWFFEGGTFGLICYTLYCILLCRWSIRQARRAPQGRSPTAFAVAAAWLALLLLTAGTPEISLQTAVQYELYGFLALLSVSHIAKLSESRAGEQHPAMLPRSQ